MPAMPESLLLQFPSFGIHICDLLEARMVVTTFNDHVRLLSPGPWLSSLRAYVELSGK